jgi:hypothetical protein
MTGLHKMPVVAMGWPISKNVAANLMPRNELNITFHMGTVHLENADRADSAKLTWKIGMTRLERKCPEMWVPIWCWGIYWAYRACAPEECSKTQVYAISVPCTIIRARCIAIFVLCTFM